MKNNIQTKSKDNVKIKIDNKEDNLVVKQKEKSVKKYRNNYNKVSKNKKVKIIPLGGLDEMGKNMTLVEYENEIIIIDCGLQFPDYEMLGIDIVIPDFSYVVENKDKIKGVLVTHGHEDHIGGLAYLFKAVGHLPVYGTKLTLGIIEGKLKEHKLLNGAKLNVIKPRDIIKLGLIKVEFIAVNHSIPDACSIAITTPAGIIVHTGDFKVDFTPINGDIIDLARFAELGNAGVLALLSESTNSERPGMTTSEKKVGESFEMFFKRAHNKRVIIATFASNIHRVQQIMNIAASSKRKVAVSGKSMETVVAKAIETGYLKVPKNTFINIDEIKNYNPGQLIIVTTGSQGEPMSALKRMSQGDHKKVEISSQDFIIISATPIPGNEKFVNKVINDLMKLEAEVVYENMYDVHVSGHACQNELKLMISLTKPKYFMPVHGEYKHLRRHADIAISMGISSKNVHMGTLGQVIEISDERIEVIKTIHVGKTMVDGLGIGDVGNIVLRDRKHLSEDGLIIVVAAINQNNGTVVSGPDIVSRGFVYVRESEDIVNETRNIAKDVLGKCFDEGIRDWIIIKSRIKDELARFIHSKIKRYPMILPIIQDVYM